MAKFYLKEEKQENIIAQTTKGEIIIFFTPELEIPDDAEIIEVLHDDALKTTGKDFKIYTKSVLSIFKRTEMSRSSVQDSTPKYL